MEALLRRFQHIAKFSARIMNRHVLMCFAVSSAIAGSDEPTRRSVWPSVATLPRSLVLGFNWQVELLESPMTAGDCAVLRPKHQAKQAEFIDRPHVTEGRCERRMGTWLERWERPNCWMALSADQGSSSVRWHLRR